MIVIDSYVHSSPEFDFENCLQFDGVNDHCYNSAILNRVLNFQPYTISLFVKWNVVAYSGIFLLHSNNGGGWNPQFYYNSNKLYFGAYKSVSGTTGMTVNFTPTVGQWYHFVITFDGVDKTNISSYKIYIDKVSQTLTEFTTVFANGTNGTIIGRCHQTTGPTTINGSIDEMVIFRNRLASQLEIDQFYTNASKIPENVLAFAPTAKFTFNHTGTDTTLVDTGSDATNLTLLNFPSSGMWTTH